MILVCRCANAEVLDPSTREQVLRWLAGSACAADVVDDLCGLAARRDPMLKSLAGPGPHAVVACHARAVRWLLRFAGVEATPDDITLLNMRERSAEGTIGALSSLVSKGPPSSRECAKTQASRAETGPEGTVSREESSRENGSRERESRGSAGQGVIAGSWVPWYPVIDYDRCVNCGRCAEFCLFGVYGEDDEGAVRVERPSRCKTNCPACARTCPEVAIIFPKHAEGPISGAEVRPEDLSRGDLRVQPARQRRDIEAALRLRGGR